MRVIFLDFDGVLTSRESMIRNNNAQDFEKFDDKCVGILNEIIARTGAVIVVTSGRRIGKMRVQLREMLHEAGVVGIVIDKTEVLRFGGEKRGLEIQDWLDRFRSSRDSIEGIVILDDDTDMEHLRDYLVLTNTWEGLQQEHIDKAVKILMTPWEKKK